MIFKNQLSLSKAITLCFVLFIFSVSTLTAQEPEQTYKLPPQELIDIADAPFTPRISFSPDNEYFLLLEYPGFPSIEEVSQPELRLAGLRINPRTNGPSRSWYNDNIVIKKISDGIEKEVTGLPEKRHLSNIDWSSDSKKVAFTNTTTDGVYLWILDIDKGMATKVSDLRINDAYGDPFHWIDNKALICKTISESRGEVPEKQLVPVGPIIQENLGSKKPARTYQDLLKNEYDESVFEYYSTSQLAKISIDGKSALIGSPQLYSDAIPSPDGKYLLIETLHKPYSYTVPMYRFPLKSEVWDLSGNPVAFIADLPLADNIPVPYGSTRTGRRSISWRADAKATLYWTEALDDGDAGKEAEFRDEVFTFSAPFNGDPISLIKLNLRYSGVMWGDDKLALVSSFWWKTRQVKTWRVMPGKTESTPELIVDRSYEDRYSDPGRPLMTESKYGTRVLLTADNGKTLFLSGDGASPEGDIPFLNEFNLKTKETTKLFQSEAPYYEYAARVIDAKKRLLLTRRESVTEQPNYYIRNLKKDELTQVTNFPHPTPQLKDVQKEQIRYERADGVKLTGTLYLPPGYKKEDGALPVLMWAYPQEYKSADAAGQVTDSPYRFVRVGRYSAKPFLSLGYAILDDPSMPIVGEGDVEPNDTYIDQLVSSAQAAVDELVRRGVGDPNRMAVGGHSYGAFMVANLLAHSDLFKLGIARSGAYNRSLTPFGFQSEDRTFWEAPEVYFAMSPFMHADKVDEPILLIHGEADNNSGTYPLQSERFYAALKGHGATARLVMLPNESHGYRGRASVMHCLFEMNDWLDKYVKNAE